MTASPASAIETMREKLEAGMYDVSDLDRELLLNLSSEISILGPSRYSDHRHEFLLRRGLVMAEKCGGLAEAIESKEAAKQIVDWINRNQNDSPETNKDYRVSLRNIGKIVTDGDDIPESVEWVPGGYPKNYDPAPDPAEMLRWDEDIQPMLDACHNSRDRALIALAFDAGPRPGELFKLTRDVITDHKYGLQITFNGKTGRRSPVLIPSVPYVRRWLDDHPGTDTDALWCGLKKPGSVSNNRIRDILKEVAERADVSKPVTPSNFRKSSASFLASQGVSQVHLEDHHGWTRGSRVAARYIAVFNEANEREIARAHGLDVDADEPDPTGPIICPRCEQKTPREKDACVWCDQVLSQSAAEKVEEQRQTAIADMPNVEREVREALANVEGKIGDDISLRVELIDSE